MLAILLTVLSKIVGVAVPILFKRVIAALQLQTTTTSFQPVATLLFAYCIARLTSAISRDLHTSVFASAKRRMKRRVAGQALAIIHNLGAEWHTRVSSGSVVRTVNVGSHSILDICGALIFGIVPSLFELSLVLSVMLYRGWFKAILVVMVMFVASTIWSITINARFWKSMMQRMAWESEGASRLMDSMINYETVTVFGNAELEAQKFDSCMASCEQAAVTNDHEYALLNMGQKAIFTIGLSSILATKVAESTTGADTVSDLGLIIVMLQQFWGPLTYMSWQYRSIKRSLLELQQFFELLKTKPTVVDIPGAKELTIDGGAIEFDNVSFTYPEQPRAKLDENSQERKGQDTFDDTNKTKDHSVVKNLTFRVPPSQKYAIVGESGSGKSTALRLLYRMYNLNGGRILIDDQDISEVTMSSLRKAIAMVPQETILFNDTIAYNIGYGRPDASMEEIMAAAKAASIHDTVKEMKDGYDTICGERGVRLSGGEKQRLSAARAFLKGSKIILQDEATSALDSKTETEVCESLRHIGKNRTSLVVAHRLSTIFDADRIIVMNKGVVVEEGTHTSLLEISGGVYKGMWERQQDSDRKK